MAMSVQSEKQKNGGQRSYEVTMRGVQIRQVF